MSDDIDLKVALFAKGVEVASSKDPAIWVSAMALITGVTPATPTTLGVPAPSAAAGESAQSKVDLPPTIEEQAPDRTDPITKMAEEIGVSREELEGAAGPSLSAPFIHLDHKYWEALKSTAGMAKTAPPVLAATLLLLWDRHAKIGEVTLRTCGEVLKTVDLTTKNASRGFKNCDWLQLRGNLIKLNPAVISKGEKLAAAYCRSRTK